MATQRPLILDNGRVRQLTPAERIPLQHVPVFIERTLEWAQTTPNRFQRMMDYQEPNYTLPAVPSGAIEVQINGVGVNYTLVGASLTITEYSSSDIAVTDQLTVYYTGSVGAGLDKIHELIVSGGEAVMAEAA